MVSEKTTLKTHLTTVLMTPFIFVFAAVYMKSWKLAVIALAVVILYFSGPRFDDFKLTRPQLIAIVAGVVFLWFVATLLSVWDHFRYRGWSLCDGQYDQEVLLFVDAILKRDFSRAYSHCTSEYRVHNGLSEFEQHAARVLQQLGSVHSIMTLGERPGYWELSILAGAVPLLDAFADRSTAAVALKLFDRTEGEFDKRRIPALRVRLKQEQEVRVDAFDFVETSLNQNV